LRCDGASFPPRTVYRTRSFFRVGGLCYPQVRDPGGKMRNLAAVKLRLVENTDDVADLMSWLGERRAYLGWDIETGEKPGRPPSDALDWWRGNIRLVQFGDPTAGWALDYRNWRGVVNEILTRYEEPIVAHNAKFDTTWMRYDGCGPPDLLWRIHDTRTMAHLLESHLSTSLKAVATRRYGREASLGQYKLNASMRKNGWTWGTVPIENPVYWAYGALDTVLTSMLAEDLMEELRLDPAFPLYDDERAAAAVLQDMEMRGMRIDRSYLWRMSQEYGAYLEDLQGKWEGLNLRSDPQVTLALERRGVTLTERTEKGALKVDKTVLAPIVAAGGPAGELAAAVLDYRKHHRLKRMYFDGLLERANGDIVHPDINPLGAQTGRMSCSRPNLQNQPRGRVVRDAFIPREGHSLVLADYAQQEYRVYASYCGDPLMLQAFREGEDLHTFTTKVVLGTEDEETIAKRRPVFKSVGFGNIYGAGVEKLASIAGVSVAEAEHFLAEYNSRFTQAVPFNESVAAEVKRRARVLGGSYGLLRDAYGGRQWVRADEGYVGVNYLVQGSCARVLKRKLAHLHAANLAQYAVLPVHDEVIFDVPTEEVEEFVAALPDVMEEREMFAVPLTVEVNVTSESWGAAKG
jgi:DNA polymerase-1